MADSNKVSFWRRMLGNDVTVEHGGSTAKGSAPRRGFSCVRRGGTAHAAFVFFVTYVMVMQLLYLPGTTPPVTFALTDADDGEAPKESTASTPARQALADAEVELQAAKDALKEAKHRQQTAEQTRDQRQRSLDQAQAALDALVGAASSANNAAADDGADAGAADKTGADENAADKTGAGADKNAGKTGAGAGKTGAGATAGTTGAAAADVPAPTTAPSGTDATAEDALAEDETQGTDALDASDLMETLMAAKPQAPASDAATPQAPETQAATSPTVPSEGAIHAAQQAVTVTSAELQLAQDELDGANQAVTSAQTRVSEAEAAVATARHEVALEDEKRAREERTKLPEGLVDASEVVSHVAHRGAWAGALEHTSESDESLAERVSMRATVTGVAQRTYRNSVGEPFQFEDGRPEDDGAYLVGSRMADVRIDVPDAARRLGNGRVAGIEAGDRLTVSVDAPYYYYAGSTLETRGEGDPVPTYSYEQWNAEWGVAHGFRVALSFADDKVPEGWGLYQEHGDDHYLRLADGADLNRGGYPGTSCSCGRALMPCGATAMCKRTS